MAYANVDLIEWPNHVLCELRESGLAWDTIPNKWFYLLLFPWYSDRWGTRERNRDRYSGERDPWEFKGRVSRRGKKDWSNVSVLKNIYLEHEAVKEMPEVREIIFFIKTLFFQTLYINLCTVFHLFYQKGECIDKWSVNLITQHNCIITRCLRSCQDFLLW